MQMPRLIHTAPKHIRDAWIARQLTKEGKSPIAPKVRGPLEWFQDGRALRSTPSAAEELVIKELEKYKIKFFREVSFYGLKVTEHGYARYDFYIPSKKHIIEYDSKLFHSTPEQIYKDQLKTAFCVTNNIAITRYTSKHYYHMEEEIRKLMSYYSIPRK